MVTLSTAIENVIKYDPRYRLTSVAEDNDWYYVFGMDKDRKKTDPVDLAAESDYIVSKNDGHVEEILFLETAMRLDRGGIRMLEIPDEYSSIMVSD